MSNQENITDENEQFVEFCHCDVQFVRLCIVLGRFRFKSVQQLCIFLKYSFQGNQCEL